MIHCAATLRIDLGSVITGMSKPLKLNSLRAGRQRNGLCR